MFLIDINECLPVNPCGKGKCTNLDGSYKCQCDKGYKITFDKKSCVGE
jgi:hypothetical protein